jgi:signal transduction histidine kinase
MLAADLHDQVLNDLKALAQKFDTYAENGDKVLVPEIESLIQQSMSEIREVMDSLCPSALEHLGLPAAIEDCCRRAATRGNFKVRFKSSADEKLIDRLGMVEKSLLYRLVQESLTNICKHAQAKVVRATVTSEDDFLEIKVADDGRGIDPDKLQADSRGLRYMRQRADLIGATIAWQQGDDGKGTVVTVRLNLANLDDNKSSHS